MVRLRDHGKVGAGSGGGASLILSNEHNNGLKLPGKSHRCSENTPVKNKILIRLSFIFPPVSDLTAEIRRVQIILVQAVDLQTYTMAERVPSC